MPLLLPLPLEVQELQRWQPWVQALTVGLLQQLGLLLLV